MAKFKVGQAVVCINNNFDEAQTNNPLEANPTKGVIYHVRGVHSTGEAILLIEIINPILKYRERTSEVYFDENAFVPVQEIKNPFKEVTFTEVRKEYPLTAN